MYNKDHIGQKIKKRREELDLTQTGLAEKINGVGAGHDFISNWETGKKTPGTGSLLLLCNALDCDLEYLIDDEVTAPRKSTYDTMVTTGLSREAVENLQEWGKSRSYLSRIEFGIVDQLLSSEAFWHNVVSHLRTARLTMQGADHQSDQEFTNAANVVNLYNLGGDTSHVLYEGKQSAHLRVQLATNAIQNIFSQIISEEK